MENEPPFDDAGLFARLDELGLAHETVEHEALYTVEQSRALRGNLTGAHIKNLFLRDKKRRMWLVTVLEDREMDLKALRHRIGARGNLSFGNAELLMQHLGVIPGAVTPFSVINDREGNVTMVLDKALLEIDPVNAHPLRNDRTTAIAPQDLAGFLEAENHAPLVLDFDEE
ncbi:MAG: prolyl-tRNA synthetase associated domain-containing protein [Alphaproteobacteria bacterium]|jgi:Ala-tRNA(Pro) deacylase|nr:prolyl-tRNA synthetase associated domain-containing protein [Alphaproteobacteria bacterium]